MPKDEPAAILSVGRLYCDLVFTGVPRLPSLGTEVFADGFSVHAGGGAFITAAHLSQLGHSTSLAAMLPSSPFGELMRPDLVTSKVDLSLCASLPMSEGPQITVAMAFASDRAFLTRTSGRAFPDLSRDDIETRNIRHIHVGEIASLVEAPELVPFARSLGLTISVDCGWDDAFDAEVLRPLIGAIDVFLPNETEMDALKRFGISETDAQMTVVKQGPNGASLYTRTGTTSAPARSVDVLDATGAGDAFNAGFLSGWLAGADLRDCLEAGNARGALAVRSQGGFSCHPADECTEGLTVD